MIFPHFPTFSSFFGQNWVGLSPHMDARQPAPGPVTLVLDVVRWFIRPGRTVVVAGTLGTDRGHSARLLSDIMNF